MRFVLNLCLIITLTSVVSSKSTECNVGNDFFKNEESSAESSSNEDKRSNNHDQFHSEDKRSKKNHYCKCGEVSRAELVDNNDGVIAHYNGCGCNPPQTRLLDSIFCANHQSHPICLAAAKKPSCAKGVNIYVCCSTATLTQSTSQPPPTTETTQAPDTTTAPVSTIYHNQYAG